MNIGDQYLQTLDIRYNDRWRNFGIFLAYTAFNAFLAYVSPSVSTNVKYLSV
jgi:ABC-type multidrug transport system permease subunit